MADQSKLQIAALEVNPERVAEYRRQLANGGFYGGRVTVSQLRGSVLPFAPYVFDLVICLTDDHGIADSEFLRVVRPYGGGLYIASRVTLDAKLTNEFEIKKDDQFLHARRGALPGAKNWTHNYGSPANLQCSEDERVQGPFGILWFGEPGPQKRVDRHATAPMPLVVDGIMFLEGYDILMAYDVYNGRKYWERWIPGITRNRLPVGVSNLVADEKHLYAIAANKECLQLDARTGETVGAYPVPELDGHDHHYWGWIAKVGDTIYGSRADADLKRRSAMVDSNHAVFALDAESGDLKWLREGVGIDNDSIAIADGQLFCVDRNLTDAERQTASESTIQDDSVEDRKPVDRRGNEIPPDFRKIVALDAETGAELWTKPFNFTDVTIDDQAIGSHIGFSVLSMAKSGVLVLSGQGSLGHPYREYQSGEFARRAIYAFDTKSGELLWGGRRNYRKRPVIIGANVYAEPHAWNLKTGDQLTTINPLTGAEAPLDFLRGYSGCGHLVASGTALFGNAGSGGLAHYNLGEHDGYTPFGNLQLACGTNAVPAGGVFVAPEGRSGCTCSTPIYTSAVLYPGRERSGAWSFSAGGAEPLDCLPVKHVAVNLGAPGFRTDAAGQLWLPYSGERFTGRFREWIPQYQHDRSMFYAESSDLLPIADANPGWVYSSGYAADKNLVFPMLDPERHEAATYTVRLNFAEPDDLKIGERVFDVSIQGQQLLTDFDIVAEAGAARKAHVVEFTGVAVKDRLTITLTPKGERSPVLCGFEARREK